MLRAYMICKMSHGARSQEQNIPICRRKNASVIVSVAIIMPFQIDLSLWVHIMRFSVISRRLDSSLHPRLNLSPCPQQAACISNAITFACIRWVYLCVRFCECLPTHFVEKAVAPWRLRQGLSVCVCGPIISQSTVVVICVGLQTCEDLQISCTSK